MPTRYQGFRGERWYKPPEQRTLINSGASSVVVSMAAIQSYSMLIFSTKPASHSVSSGAYVLGRDVRVNSVVPNVSFMFVKATATTAPEVVCWTLLNTDMKKWR